MQRVRLVELEIAAEPEAWAAAGFAVEDVGGTGARCRIGVTDVVLRGAAGGSGILGWTLEGAVPEASGLDGLATAAGHRREAAAGEHRNGVVAIDHVVVTTPDTARTFETLDAAGLELRRVRDAGTAERPLRQGFFLLEEALVEVVGPPEREGDEPAAFWGLTLVSGDLEATARCLGDALSEPREAVQPGRRIAVAGREAGLGTRVAFMTPREPGGA